MREESDVSGDSTELIDEVLLEIVNAKGGWHSPHEVEAAASELRRRGFKLTRTEAGFHTVPQRVEPTRGKSSPGAPGPAPSYNSATTPVTTNPDGRAKVRLNWLRILRFTLLILIVTFGVGFFCGVLASLYNRNRGDVPLSYDKILERYPTWLIYIQSAAMTVSTATAFILLSYRQRERTLMHVSMVALACWLISVPNVLLGQPLVEWASGIAYVLILAVISVPISLDLQARKEIAQLKMPPIGR